MSRIPDGPSSSATSSERSHTPHDPSATATSRCSRLNSPSINPTESTSIPQQTTLFTRLYTSAAVLRVSQRVLHIERHATTSISTPEDSPTLRRLPRDAADRDELLLLLHHLPDVSTPVGNGPGSNPSTSNSCAASEPSPQPRRRPRPRRAAATSCQRSRSFLRNH